MAKATNRASAAKKSHTKKPAAKKAKRKAAAKKTTRVSTAAQRAPVKPRPSVPKSREGQAARRARAERLLAELRAEYPHADCALHHRSAYELLVATILSAQCTDERVNQVTPALFRRVPAPPALAAIEQAELEDLIRSTGFFRNKAKALIGMGQRVVADHGGEIPETMGELLKLPGVARKTANCVLGTWYHENEGIVVDTHVGRLGLRLGLLTSAKNDKDAVKIEQDLMELFPRESWTFLAHALILHGRQVCQARKPKCGECRLAADCPAAGKLG
jgi:endonuclease III